MKKIVSTPLDKGLTPPFCTQNTPVSQLENDLYEENIFVQKVEKHVTKSNGRLKTLIKGYITENNKIKDGIIYHYSDTGLYAEEYQDFSKVHPSINFKSLFSAMSDLEKTKKNTKCAILADYFYDLLDKLFFGYQSIDIDINLFLSSQLNQSTLSHLSDLNTLCNNLENILNFIVQHQKHLSEHIQNSVFTYSPKLDSEDRSLNLYLGGDPSSHQLQFGVKTGEYFYGLVLKNGQRQWIQHPRFLTLSINNNTFLTSSPPKQVWTRIPRFSIKQLGVPAS